MISRNLFKTIGGSDERFKYAEDIETWIRCIRAGFKFAYTGNSTCLYRKGIGGLTSKVLETTFETALVYEKNFDWAEIPLKIRKKYTSGLWLSAARIVRSSDKSLSKKYLSKSLKYNLTATNLLLWVLLRF